MRCTGLFVALLCLTPGCSLPANPHTSVGFNPWSHTIEFYDSKDNEIEIAGLTYSRETGDFKLERMAIRNNASDVRRANVEQINAYTEQVKATTAMMTQMTASLASMLPYLRPAVTTSINTPYGGGTISATPILAPATPPPDPFPDPPPDSGAAPPSSEH